jgi:hypothetical protein
MERFGYVALGVVLAGAAVVIGLVASSVPDIARYLRLRRM